MTTGRGSAAPAPRRTDARRNRERLTAAAHEVFTEAGPGASLNEIARRAGVGPGTLYRHFPNRQALLTAVLRDRIQALCERAETLRTAETPDDALAHWLGAFLAHARANHGMGTALLVDEPGAPGIDCHRLILDAAARVLARAQEHGTARADLTARDLVRLVTGIALSTAGDEDPEAAHRLLALVVDAAHASRRPSPAGEPGSGP